MKRHYTEKYLINPSHKVTIAVIGIGGTGTQVLSCLLRMNEALIGIGHPGIHVIAYDHDIVTASNIGRQLFTNVDIGLNKAVVMISRINRFMGYEWEAVPSKYTGFPTNIIISCVDTAAARFEIAKIAKSLNHTPTKKIFYWLDFGNNKTNGQFVLGTYQKIEQPNSEFETIEQLPSIIKRFKLNKREKDTGPSCSIAQALGKQDLFINSTLANLGCDLLWKLFKNAFIDYAGGFLNLESNKFNSIKL